MNVYAVLSVCESFRSHKEILASFLFLFDDPMDDRIQPLLRVCTDTFDEWFVRDPERFVLLLVVLCARTLEQQGVLSPLLLRPQQLCQALDILQVTLRDCAARMVRESVQNFVHSALLGMGEQGLRTLEPQLSRSVFEAVERTYLLLGSEDPTAEAAMHVLTYANAEPLDILTFRTLAAIPVTAPLCAFLSLDARLSRHIKGVFERSSGSEQRQFKNRITRTLLDVPVELKPCVFRLLGELGPLPPLGELRLCFPRSAASDDLSLFNFRAATSSAMTAFLVRHKTVHIDLPTFIADVDNLMQGSIRYWSRLSIALRHGILETLRVLADLNRVLLFRVAIESKMDHITLSLTHRAVYNEGYVVRWLRERIVARDPWGRLWQRYSRFKAFVRVQEMGTV